MNEHVENVFNSRNGICDDNDMCNVLHLSGTINTASNSKKFSFSRCYIHYMIHGFDNVLTSINIQD